jgi:hypothetical protein
MTAARKKTLYIAVFQGGPDTPQQADSWLRFLSTRKGHSSFDLTLGNTTLETTPKKLGTERSSCLPLSCAKNSEG